MSPFARGRCVTDHVTVSQRRGIRCGLSGFLVTLLAGVLLTGTGVSAAASPFGHPQGNYVALGDSFAASPLVPNLVDLNCLRSDHDYPAIAGQLIGLPLRDVSCSGATLGNLTGLQGTAQPQFDALGGNTRLVTMTMGANDIGLVPVALSCVNLLPELLGTPCVDRYTAGGTDQLAARISALAPKYGRALDAIHRRAPNAKVEVVGYPTYAPPNGCWPLVPVYPRDTNYLQKTLDRLNHMMATEAAQHGASYVDLATPSIGHDACRFPLQNWVNGLVPVSVTPPTYLIGVPLHPTGPGAIAFGRLVAKAVQQQSSNTARKG